MVDGKMVILCKTNCYEHNGTQGVDYWTTRPKNDVSILKAIKTLVNSKAKEEVNKLSDFQKERIVEGREQVLKGETISHEELQREIDQWLKLG